MGDVYHLLASQARFLPDRPALTGPGRAPLTYARLLAQAEEVAARLNRGGVGRHDRVAIVLPNGPEMAAAFLSVAACATAAPLNPGFRAAELEFYLSDLQARALIVEAGKDSPARSVAHRLRIPIVELLPAGDSPASRSTDRPHTTHPPTASPRARRPLGARRIPPRPAQRSDEKKPARRQHAYRTAGRVCSGQSVE